ncbi:hypothetical protein H4R26_003581 [Coemansia thaxteri]|uniref:BRCT domain-containing protein n=1 Tax=Coemansia thaxteri TaxID=2663907 RepID=A0A9W8EHH6_9FUNG|nr:hypothetical protein H4R26_003581 [Coemansia thaxteri]
MAPDEEGPLEIQLYSGRSAIGGASGTAVCLARALAIDAAVEIGDGLHVLYDYGSAGGVFLGHRRARVRPGVGYVLSDGKLVWFGQTCFWYRVLDDLRKSPSPPPPWRMPKALPDARPRAARLRREIAAAAITHSPPQQPLLSLPASPSSASLDLSPMLVKSPAYGSDSESVPLDTEPLSPHASDYDEDETTTLSRPLLYLPSAHSSGLRMDALSVDEVSAMASDSDAEPSNPPERRPATPPQPTLSPPARSISPPAQSISPPTQPVSPSRRPPQLAQTTSGLGVAALNAKDTPSSFGVDNISSTPQVDSGKCRPSLPSDVSVYLPQPSALVCAPSRVILVGPMLGQDSVPPWQQPIPRYPYDIVGMESFLRSATQATLPTQPDPSDWVPESSSYPASAETVQSSDFSQAFLAPSLPPGLCSAKAGSDRMSVDLARKSPHGAQSSGALSADTSSVASTPAAAGLPNVSGKRHRRSIDNFTDEEEEEERGKEEGEGDSPALPPPPPAVASAKRHSAGQLPGSRSGLRAGAASGSLSLSTAPSSSAGGTAVAAARSSQRFSTPTFMSSRQRHYQRHTPLNLQPSRAPHPPPPPPLLNFPQPRTPMTRATNHYPNAGSGPSAGRSVRSAGSEASHHSMSRTLVTTASHDGFPDSDVLLPASMLVTQSAARASRSQRRFTQGGLLLASPLTLVATHSPAAHHPRVPNSASVAHHHHAFHPLMSGVSESPAMESPPLTAFVRHSPRLASEVGIGKSKVIDEIILSSSPVLPQPAALLDPTAPSMDETFKSNPVSETKANDLVLFGLENDKELLTSEEVVTAESGAEQVAAEQTDADDTQLDHDGSIATERPPPRIHLRVPVPDVVPTAVVTPKLADSNGWINMDDVAQLADTPTTKPTRAAALRRGQKNCSKPRAPSPSSRSSSSGGGASSTNSCSAGGSSESTTPQYQASTPVAAVAGVSPAVGLRSSSLRDSLRKLPGNRGLGRTGLLTSKRAPPRVGRHTRAAVGATGSTSASVSPSPKLGGVATRAATAGANLDTSATTLTNTPATAQTQSSAALLEQEKGGARPSRRIAAAAAGGNRGSSHRNLDLAQTTPARVAMPPPPSKRKSSDRAPVPARLTRQNSIGDSLAGAIKTVAISGFQGDELDRVSRQLETHGLNVTENPLFADICVRQGKLGRTLKVLCALARGTPVVSRSWVLDLSSVASRTRTGTNRSLADLAQTHLLADRLTEREWGITLADILRRACDNANSGHCLLASYCVYILGDVARPDPVCLSVMVKSAGGYVLNDFGRREELLLKGLGSAPQPSLSRCQSSSMTTGASGDCVADIHGESLAGEGNGDGLSESSTEPDDDSDEDWSAGNDIQSHARRSSASGVGGNLGNGGARRKRKTLPKLAKIEHDELSDGNSVGASGANALRAQLKSEPSMVFVPPPGSEVPAATTPVRVGGGGGETSISGCKRRRVQESPSMSATAAMLTDTSAPLVSFDPHCSRQDLLILLSARKAELGIPDDTRFVIVSANAESSVKKKWESHGATVVEPEQIIQTIVRCNVQF